MAKKWTPSLKQLSLYDELLKRQNQTRKRLLKRRRIAETEGSSFGRPLPDLVLPMKVRRFRDVSRYSKRFDSYKDYQEKMRALRSLFGSKGDPTFNYFKATYRANILKLLRSWIEEKLNFRLPPEAHGRYSKEQIELANYIGEDAGKYLEFYNKLINLETSEFQTMYDTGLIPRMRYIYNEMEGVGQFSVIDEFIQNVKDYRRMIREDAPNIMIESVEAHQRRAEWYKYTDRKRNEKGQFAKGKVWDNED